MAPTPSPSRPREGVRPRDRRASSSARTRRGRLLLGLVALCCLVLPATSAEAGGRASCPSAFKLHRMLKARGGGSAAAGGGRASFPMPLFPPPVTLPGQQPPKSGSSSSTGSLWGSQHFDDRPLVLEPRHVDNLKARDSRLGLIRKVYTVLTGQLLITTLVTVGFFKNPQAVRYLLSPRGNWAVLLSFVASLGSALALGFKYARQFPVNLSLLAVFTAGESVLIGLLASMHKAESVLLAAAQTGAVTLGLTLWALRNKNPKYDLTAFGSSLAAGLLIFVTSTILAAVFRFPMNDVMIGGFGAALFSLFFIHDTQRIVGGPNHAHQMDDRDWCLASMELYMDITRLFLYILRMVASDNGGGGQD